MHENKLKIAVISSSAPPLSSGGISSAHYNLYCTLKESGFNAILLTFGDNKKNNLHEENGIKRFGTPILFVMLIKFLFKYINKYFLGENSYQLKDVALSQIGSLRLSISLKNVKADYIIVSDHGSPLLSIKKPKKSKVILISHHNPIRFINEPLIGNFSIRDAKLASKIEHYTLQKVDIVICPSKYMNVVFIKTHNFLRQINVIPNIVSENVINQASKYNLHEKLGLPKNTSIIYIPSADSIFKGGKYVFEIVRRLTSTSNNKIGFYLSGNIGSQLMTELSLLNAHIYTPGQQSYIDNISCVKACTFCISPTLIESFGMAILEANFCGLPAITFNIGGTSDIIIDENNGFLVDFLDIEKLIEKANLLLTKHELTEQMQKNSKNIAKEMFGAEVILEQYNNIFKQYLPQ